MEAAIGEVKMKKKKKKKSWNDQEPSTSHALEVGCMNCHSLLVAIAQMIRLNFFPLLFSFAMLPGVEGEARAYV